MKINRIWSTCLLAATLVAGTGVAAAPTTAGSTPPVASASPVAPAPDCHGSEYRALDFWVGSWEVSDTESGKHVGQSKIESLLEGCVIRESFTGQPPYRGSSYSSFDRQGGKWHQDYIDSNGGNGRFVGVPTSGQLDLIADKISQTGAAYKIRLVIRTDAGGTVRQIVTISLDDGKTWQPGYDFTYRRRATGPEPLSVR